MPGRNGKRIFASQRFNVLFRGRRRGDACILLFQNRSERVAVSGKIRFFFSNLAAEILNRRKPMIQRLQLRLPVQIIDDDWCEISGILIAETVVWHDVAEEIIRKISENYLFLCILIASSIFGNAFLSDNRDTINRLVSITNKFSQRLQKN